MSKLRLLSTTLTAFVFISAVPVIAEDAASSGNRRELIKGEPKERMEFECEVPYLCWEDGLPVVGGSYAVTHPDPDGMNDCEECIELAGCSSNNGDCYEGSQICCDEIPAVGECANLGVEPTCTSRKYIVRDFEYKFPAENKSYTFSAIEDDGQELFEFTAVGLTSERTFRTFSRNRSQAWSLFLKIANYHGGITPGTLKSRQASATLHRCYIRIRSTKDDTVYDEEIQVNATSQVKAIVGAYDAAVDLAAYLRNVEEHSNVTILAGLRLTTEANQTAAICIGPQLCRHECTAGDGKTIQTSRYRKTRALACAAAAAAAEVIADNYGGVVQGTCRNLDPVAISSNRTAAEPCEDCVKPGATGSTEDGGTESSGTDAATR